MNLARSVAVVLASVSIATIPAAASTYYVAQNDPKASDEAAGSEAAPWKTMTHGLGSIQSGDTLYVKKGVYREEIILPRTAWNWANINRPAFKASGKSYAEMTSILAFPGDDVAIKASDLVTDWKPFKDKIYVHENWTVNTQLVACDDKLLDQIHPTMPKMLMDVLDEKVKKDGDVKDMTAGSFFYDQPGKKLYVWLADGSDPAKHVMEIGVRSFLFNLDADYVRVSGLKMRHSTISSVVNWACVGIGGANNIIENCEITDSDFTGMSVGGQCNTIIKCKINHHGDSGIGGSGWGHRFIDCETSYNNYRNFSMGWHAGGVKIIPYAHDILMTGHIAAHNEGDGIWFDSGNFNVTVQNSVSHHNKGSGIFYEISERGTFRNNVCYENLSRGIYLSNSSDCQVLHNVLYRNGMSGVASIGVDRAYAAFGEGDKHRLAARNNVVWGNIFYDNCDPKLCPKDLDGRDKPWDTRAELVLPETKDNDINTGNVSDYNIFYRAPGRVLPFWKGWHQEQFKDLAEWQEKTGNDKHSIVADPKFVDAAKDDFRPAKDSPAFNFVKPRMGATYAADGKWRRAMAEGGADKAETKLTAGPYEPEPEKKP
jgi:parallel beta-helix repeat protein